MKRIASFEVNHDSLTRGFYTSRADGDVITYDLRTHLPNSGNYIDNDETHTFEHLFATYARNSQYADGIVYFGPMGCQTGFYLLTRDSITPPQAIALVRETLDFIAGFEGEIPGSTPRECGNAKSHSLPKAKALAASMIPVLRDWTEQDLKYRD